MSDTYVECLVKKESSTIGKLARIVLVMITVVFGILTFLGFVLALFVALALILFICIQMWNTNICIWIRN